MTTDRDSRLVDYLYDELPEEEAEAFERALESDDALSSEFAGFEETLQMLRTVEMEEPPPHLDSLILLHARQAVDEQKKKSWFRKVFASPLAGLVTAASVAMIIAVVAVPSLMLVTSKEAPYRETGETAIEPLPSPTMKLPADEPSFEEVPDPAPKAEPSAPKKKKNRSGVAEPRQDVGMEEAKPVPLAAPPAPPKKLDTAFAQDDGIGRRGVTQHAKGAASGVMADPPSLRPSPQAEAQSEEIAVERDKRAIAPRTREAERSAARDEPARNDQAMREERGWSMLSAASAEFKRNNPEGGRRILVRALAVVGDAPVHAEIAFRLAEHDLSRGAYDESVYYARIAASAAKFDKRKAALDLVVEAEKRLAEERSVDRKMASPPAATDSNEAR